MPCLNYAFLQADVYLSFFVVFYIGKVNTLSVQAAAACQARPVVIN